MKHLSESIQESIVNESILLTTAATYLIVAILTMGVGKFIHNIINSIQDRRDKRKMEKIARINMYKAGMKRDFDEYFDVTSRLATSHPNVVQSVASIADSLKDDADVKNLILKKDSYSIEDYQKLLSMKLDANSIKTLNSI